jgi:hypothetical protein
MATRKRTTNTKRMTRPRRKKATARRYSKAASKEVRTEMRHLKQGKHPRRLKSRKQAVAIGLSKARRKGKKVPARPRRK